MPLLGRRGAPVDWLIVGLGNPGAQYAGTPHNVGYEVANRLAARWDLPKPRSRYRGLITEGRAALPGIVTDAPAGLAAIKTASPRALRVAILLPQTYMNDSGRSVGPARGELRIEPDHVLVLHDEIDLPFGEVRTRLGGGLAGHNGLKSIKAALGTADFHRVRIGVGRPGSTDPEIVAAYVLGRFREPQADVEALIDSAADAAQQLLS